MKRRTTDGAGDREQMGSENRNKGEKRLIDKYVTGSVEMWRNKENHDGDNVRKEEKRNGENEKENEWRKKSKRSEKKGKGE